MADLIPPEAGQAGRAAVREGEHGNDFLGGHGSTRSSNQTVTGGRFKDEVVDFAFRQLVSGAKLVRRVYIANAQPSICDIAWIVGPVVRLQGWAGPPLVTQAARVIE